MSGVLAALLILSALACAGWLGSILHRRAERRKVVQQRVQAAAQFVTIIDAIGAWQDQQETEAILRQWRQDAKVVPFRGARRPRRQRQVIH